MTLKWSARRLRDQDRNALIGCRRIELPAHDVAGIDSVALQGNATQARALQIAGIEAPAVCDAVDPQAAFGVDVLAVSLCLQLRSVDLFEIVRIAGHLPGELASRRTSRGTRNLFAERVAHIQYVDRIGVDLLQGEPAVIQQRLQIFLIARPLVSRPHDEPRRSATAANPPPPVASWSVLKLMRGVGRVSSVRTELAMGKQAVRHFQHHLLRFGRSVVQHQESAGWNT